MGGCCPLHACEEVAAAQFAWEGGSDLYGRPSHSVSSSRIRCFVVSSFAMSMGNASMLWLPFPAQVVMIWPPFVGGRRARLGKPRQGLWGVSRDEPPLREEEGTGEEGADGHGCSDQTEGGASCAQTDPRTCAARSSVRCLPARCTPDSMSNPCRNAKHSYRRR